MAVDVPVLLSGRPRRTLGSVRRNVPAAQVFCRSATPGKTKSVRAGDLGQLSAHLVRQVHDRSKQAVFVPATALSQASPRSRPVRAVQTLMRRRRLRARRAWAPAVTLGSLRGTVAVLGGVAGPACLAAAVGVAVGREATTASVRTARAATPDSGAGGAGAVRRKEKVSAKRSCMPTSTAWPRWFSTTIASTASRRALRLASVGRATLGAEVARFLMRGITGRLMISYNFCGPDGADRCVSGDGVFARGRRRQLPRPAWASLRQGGRWREQVEHVHAEPFAQTRDRRDRDVRLARLDRAEHRGVELARPKRSLLLGPSFPLAEPAEVCPEPLNDRPTRRRLEEFDALLGAALHKRRVTPSGLAKQWTRRLIIDPPGRGTPTVWRSR